MIGVFHREDLSLPLLGDLLTTQSPFNLTSSSWFWSGSFQRGQLRNTQGFSRGCSWISARGAWPWSDQKHQGMGNSVGAAQVWENSGKFGIPSSPGSCCSSIPDPSPAQLRAFWAHLLNKWGFGPLFCQWCWIWKLLKAPGAWMLPAPLKATIQGKTQGFQRKYKNPKEK